LNRKKKHLIINQPAGLGDIFFLQKAAKLHANTGYNVIWPINPEFSYLNDYLKYPNIKYYSHESEFPLKEHFNKNVILKSKITLDDENMLYCIPFVHADYTMSLKSNFISSMKCKYPFINLSNENWADYFEFTRNKDRELNLKNRLGIGDNEEFIFVNNLFASPPQMLKREININSKCKIVYNDGLPCHIFDYCWIFENAKEIHTIESAFCYIIEKLQTTDKLFMYSRIVNGINQHANFDYIDGIHKKNWQKIQ